MSSQVAIERLEKKVYRWAKAWIYGAMQRKLFFDDPSADFRSFVGGQDNSELLGLRATRLATWYLVRYIESALGTGKTSPIDLALSARHYCAAMRIESQSASAGAGGSIAITQASICLATNIIAGWQTDALAIGEAMIGGLDNSLLDLRVNERHEAGKLFRHFWFLVLIFCDYSESSIDTSLYSFPADFSPYSEVISNWRTNDMREVQELVSSLAEYHLREARSTRHDEIAEFDEEDRMLFPYEILAFLRLREWVGLPNPATFNHPLMWRPISALPANVPLDRPETMLLDQVLNKMGV